MTNAEMTKELADKSNQSDELGRQIAQRFRKLRDIVVELADLEAKREQLKTDCVTLYNQLHR